MADLRSYLSALRRSGGLKEVRRPVSRRFEIAAVTAAADGGPAVLFEDVRGSEFRVVSNLVGTRGRFARAAGARAGGIHGRVDAAVRGASGPREARRGRFLENSASDASGLPVVTHFSKEPGPFITSSVIHAANPDTGRQNASFHRMMPLDGRHFSVRMVEGRHLHRCFEDARGHGDDLEVAVTVGVHPAVSIACAYQAEWGRSEADVANAMLGGRLSVARAPGSRLAVPSGSEIVMTGRILRDRTRAEWMVEMLQTYDRRRAQPVFELDRLYHRDGAIFHDILAGYAEHRLLMGMPAESKLVGSLRRRFPRVRQAALTDGGCNWLHAVVQVRRGPGAPARRVIAAAFEAHRSLKQVTVVDEDIDPHSPVQVEYAMATRFQADRDLVVLSGVRGSSLDPSSDQKNLRTAKVGIDATRPRGARPEGFEVARIPGASRVRLPDY